ncbi:hypothetical protein D3C78_682690 [compost metagenome]
MVQYGRAGTELRLANRCVGVTAKVIVETPATNKFTQLHDFRRGAKAADLIKQAVEIRRVLGQHFPLATVPRTDHRAIAIHQQAGRTVHGSGPDTFSFDLGVQRKVRDVIRLRHRQSQCDRVAEVFTGKAQAQTHGRLTDAAFNLNFTITHAPGEGFRPGPEGRIQTSFTGQGIDHAALGGFRQQAQRTVQVGLAAAVGAGDQIQPAQRDHQFVDRAVIGHREGREHVDS